MVLLSVLRRIRYSKEDKILEKSLKNIFGFRPENIFLYKQAFRHKSIAPEIKKGIKDSNERLEYLGDAVLGSVIADFLFKKFPYKDEGFLTEMRSKIVSREHLNKLSQKLGLNSLIKSNEVNQYRSINGDAFEAFVGALYLDKGYKFTQHIIVDFILKCHVDIDAVTNKEHNFKSKIIEWAQKEHRSIEFYVLQEIGNGYNKQYVVEVKIDNIPIAIGRDYSIKKAEQQAAELSFSKLKDVVFEKPADEPSL